MRTHRPFTLLVAIAAAPALAPPAFAAPPDAPTAEQVRFFEKEVRPVLVQHCYECHSADAKRIKGGLVLDTRAGWESGGDSGEVIVPGDVENSLFVKAVAYADEDLQMPPKYKLKDAEIAALTKWVKMGAPDPRAGKSTAVERRVIDIEQGRQFWAFRPVASPAAPKVKDAAWPRDDIDRFVLAKIEDAGLKPVGDADRYALIRRASFDLTGLPPTDQEIASFVDDPAPTPAAFAKVVDRLLASPQFGVRWGRHWLDVARYAESIGNTRNYPFPFAWRYRDYAIDAFNADKPYDQFVKEQIAGDLLPAKTAAQKDEQSIGTTFLALGSHDLNERDNRQFSADVVDEQIDMTGRAFMALTLGCARCHDHKFDPIAQSDYYAVAGIYYSTELRSGLKNRSGGNNNYAAALIELAARDGKGDAQSKPDGKRQQIARLQEELAEARTEVKSLQQQIKKLTKAKGKDAQKANELRRDKQAAQKQAQQRIRELTAKIKKLGGDVGNDKNNTGGGGRPHDFFAMGVADGKPVDAKINIKGEPSDLGAQVPRGFIRVATDPKAPTLVIESDQSGRLQLAHWMARRENPLTARVMVNRMWHHLFGAGLVRTVDNFGETGERPSHPQLLDHLATRFMDSGWSVKQTIRSIMLSRTYMLAAEFNEKNQAVEPDNRLLWRANIRRLEVEPIRDAIMHIAGSLDLSHPGPSPVMAYNNAEVGRGGTGDVNIDKPHRAVYVPVVRQYIPEMWETFDFPDPAEVKGERDVTTVAPQALFLMNSDFVVSQARQAAQRLLAEKKLNDMARLELAYLRTLGRKPTTDEIARFNAYLTSIEPASKKDAALDAWASVVHALYASAEFRYVN